MQRDNGVGDARPTKEPPRDNSALFKLVETTAPQRVIIKVKEGAYRRDPSGLSQQDDFVYHFLQQLEGPETLVTCRPVFPELRDQKPGALERLPGESPHSDLSPLARPASPLPAMLNYYECPLPPGREAALEAARRIIKQFEGQANIETVYIESPPAPLPGNCGGRPLPYLAVGANGLGINALPPPANVAWPKVIDLERVFQSGQNGHPALRHVGVLNGFDGPPDALALGDLDHDPDTNDYPIATLHSTACLGILGADGDAGPGCPGLLPKIASLSFATSLIHDDDRWAENIARQITRLTVDGFLRAGDILLLELQVWGGLAGQCTPHETPTSRNAILAPVELEPTIHAAISAATANGIIVIEPAGNGGREGGVNLDRLRTWDKCAARPSGDSGAIMVAACAIVEGEGRARRLNESNFGDRVDCYCWGDGVHALKVDNPNEMKPFTGTSAAAALITGLAARVQAEALARLGRCLKPDEMRRALKSSQRTPEAAAIRPLVERVGLQSAAAAEAAPEVFGVMPHLPDIVAQFLASLPPA